MHRGNKSLLLSGLFCLLLVGFAVVSSAVEEIESFTLANGLQILLVERHGVPIVTIDVWVNTGSINETPEVNGISHFFEHMLFKGTPKYPGGFDAVIEGLGGLSNAATAHDWTHYYITIPSEHTDVALDIMADITQNSTFPPDEVERERQVVFREIGQRADDPSQFIYTTFYQDFYGVHPYGLPIAGSHEAMNSLTRQDFLNYMRTYYVPNNMVLIVAGDIDAEETLAMVEGTFGSMEVRNLPEKEIPREPPLTEKTVKEIERDVSQGYLILGWQGPQIEDLEDVYAMDVLLSILSFGRGSRFYKTIYKELGLVTTVDAGYLTQKDPGLFTVYAEFPYENRLLVERAILAELVRVLDGDLIESEVERAKTMLLSGVSLSNETNAGIAYELGFYAIVAGDYRFALTYPDGIQDVAVEDIIAVARKYIDLDRYLELVLVPLGQETGPTAASGVVTLDNGLQLILREDRSSDVVAVQTFIGTGVRAEPDELAGIATLTQRMLMKGTTSRSEEEIFEAIENLGARIGSGDLPDMVNLFLVATKDTADRALPIYLDVLLHPAFFEEELARAKDEMARDILASADQNFNVIYENFQAALYGEHPYGRSPLGTVESIQAIDREDVVSFYEENYAANNMVVAVVGNFDVLVVQALLSRQLGKLEAGSAAADVEPIQFGLTEPRQVKSDKVSSLTWMILGYPAPSVGDPDYPAMKVQNDVIGGGMSSRLFHILRDQQGLAYSTGSFFPSRRQESHLVTYIITAPELVDAAKQGVLEILADIIENGVTEEELERAKNHVLGNFLIDHETAQRRAWYLGWYATLGVGIEMDERYPELVREITSRDLQRVAEKYFTNYVVSVLGPQE